MTHVQYAYYAYGKCVNTVRFVSAVEATKAILRVVPEPLRPAAIHVLDLDVGESLDLTRSGPLCSIRREF